MNNILKLISSENEEDRKIAYEILQADKEKWEHFFNLALYIGPRYKEVCAQEFLPFFEIYGEIIYALEGNPYGQNKLYAVWNKNGGANRKHTKKGWYYKKAKKALEELTK